MIWIIKQQNIIVIYIGIQKYVFTDTYPMNCYTKQGDVCLFPAKDANVRNVNSNPFF